MMNVRQAVDKLTALAQENRLRIFRLLVAVGDEGMKATAIAEALDLAPATFSFHVAHLTRAGLVQARQESRYIFYSVSYAAMDGLIAYLAENCCQGEACLPKTAAVNSEQKRRKIVKKTN